MTTLHKCTKYRGGWKPTFAYDVLRKTATCSKCKTTFSVTDKYDIETVKA